MPRTVRSLETSLSRYVHPDLTFLDVLNETLPQLASKGVWRDLTFEESVALERTDRFFTLPEEADAILYAMTDNQPSPVKPLWRNYMSQGAQPARAGRYYGVEDAGYVATKSILSAEHYYVLYVFPRFAWGANSDAPEIFTDSAFDGTEEITVEYENVEGVVRSVTDTLAAVDTPQILKAVGVRNIRSIRYRNFNSVEATIVAAPANFLGRFSGTGAASSVFPLPGFEKDWTTMEGTLGEVNVYSLNNLAQMDGNEEVDFDTITSTFMSNSVAYAGAVVTDEPVVVVPRNHATFAYEKDSTSEDGADTLEIATLDGTGVCRYRLFRQQSNGTTVHMLLRRRIPEYRDPDELVYIDNLPALKYALLANTAEYNNDITQARAWWSEAKRELDAELDRVTGAALPEIQFDPSGGAGGVPSFQ